MTEPRPDPVIRLRRLWEEGNQPDLANFLAGASPLLPLELANVIREDQRWRWAMGERPTAESYLAAYPAAAGHEEAAVDVVYAEFLLRKSQGEPVEPQEYLQRFPQFAGPLREQFEFIQALGGSPASVDEAGRIADPQPAPTVRGFPNAPAKARQKDSPRIPRPGDEIVTVPRKGGAGDIPAEANSRIEELCNQFEIAWVKGKGPRIEDYLAEAPDAHRPALLRELLPLDAAYRRAHGQIPRADDYQSRFPDLNSHWLAKAVAEPAGAPSRNVPSQQPFRQPRAHRIRCPHCHSPIQLIEDRPREVLCPGCGSSFRMQEANSTESAPSMRLGKFQLLDRVGHGAFGAVWRALDVELERIVALKIPHAGLAISPTELRHFLDEARKAAKLRHPGVVAIHEVTTLQGLPVIVSDFIQGATLREVLEVRRPSFPDAARLIAEVADALHYAHDQGLVHRDVKPANIMVERGRGAAVAPDGAHFGRPLVLDFGLALREEAAVTMTLDGEIIGTPAYINPEQAAGRGHHADRRSDVFSLGVVLYEMLTGELPFRGSRLMLLDQVKHDDPRSPRRINERIPRDLETICLKAMAKLPVKRYQSAADLAADLRRFLQGEPIRARREGILERMWRWRRRRPRDAALAAAAAGMLVLAAVGSTVAAFWIDYERRRAEDHLTQTYDAIDQMTKVAQEVVEDTPQLEEQQQLVLEEALKRQEQLLQERHTPVEREKLAWAYFHMGYILEKLRHSVRGKKEDLAPEAEQDFTRAIQIFRQLKTEHPNTPEYQDGEAVALDERALLLSTRSGGSEVERDYQESIAILEKLSSDPTKPPPPLVLQHLALTYNNYGIFLMNSIQPGSQKLGRFVIEEESATAGASTKKPDKLYDDAEKLLTGLEQTDAIHRDEYAADLARVLDNRGYLDAAHDNDKAVREYQGAINLLQDLTTRRPAKNEYRCRLALALHNLGDAKKDRQVFSEAEECHRKAIGLFDRLVSDFPKYPYYHQELANSLNSLGVDLKKNNQAQVGIDAGATALLDSPTGPGPLLTAATLIAARRRQLDEARTCFDNARRHFDLVLDGEPDNPEVQSLAALNHHNLGRIDQECNRLNDASAEFEQAIALQEQAHKSNRNNFDYLDRLGSHYQSHASIRILIGDYEGAAEDAGRIKRVEPATASNAFKAACVYAKCAGAADRNKAIADDCGKAAVQLLQELHDAEYKDLNLNHADLGPLRGRKDFLDLGDQGRKENGP